jgi:LPS-assembly protein
MTTRTRLLITTALVCHVLLAPRLVTSQLLPSKVPENSPSSSHVNRPTVPVTIVADRQEKDGAVYKLSGNIKIDYGVYTFSGDEGTYNSDTGDVFAEGHLVLEGGPNDDHRDATRGTYNIEKETGRFEHVTGSIGLKLRKGRKTILTGDNPFFFTGRVVVK